MYAAALASARLRVGHRAREVFEVLPHVGAQPSDSNGSFSGRPARDFAA